MDQQPHQGNIGEEQARVIVNALMDDANLVNIRTFVIVARFLSFKAAARYLCLTPGAVSHRMAKLEDALGFALFNRLTRGISLTIDGERLKNICRNAFQRFQDEVQTQLGHSSFGSLTIYSHYSIGLAWLMPRIASFYASNQTVQLHILTGNDPVSFTATTQTDLAIYYANGHFPGLNSKHIMDETVFPVCSPQYARDHGLSDDPSLLAACTLLSDSAAWHYSAPMAEWQEWCGQFNIALKPDTPTAFFDTSLGAATAACHHMGVAIGRSHIVRHMLDEGKLVRLFPSLPAQRSKYGYYAVWPRNAYTPGHIRALLSWLCGEGTC